MTRERFKLALERMDGADWQLFEEVACEFLAADYDGLREMASTSGDGGRDAELFAPSGGTDTVVQISVARDWSGKIRGTVKRIRETVPTARHLVYVTNHRISAQADELRRELRSKHELILDVRDQSWFLDRWNVDERRHASAERAAQAIVDPLLASSGVVQRVPGPLTRPEQQCAFMYLSIRREHERGGKGLRRLSYEALICAALRSTDPEQRMTRQEVKQTVKRMLPEQNEETVASEVDRALDRMAKRLVRHYRPDDSFCLTYDERERLAEMSVNRAVEEGELRDEIKERVGRLDYSAGIDADGVEWVIDQVELLMGRLLMIRGEQIASALVCEQVPSVDLRDLLEISSRAAGEWRVPACVPGTVSDDMARLVGSLLTHPGPAATRFLKQTAETYTLLSVLNQAHDVQEVVKKLFSTGDVWLDTSILLPIIAEDLRPDEERPIRQALQAARAAGLRFHVTDGVIEEVERHINNCLACVRSGSERRWSAPFLYCEFVASGQPVYQMPSWLENYCGSVRPEDDIADFLRRQLGVARTGLRESAQALTGATRQLVLDCWMDGHRRRRNQSTDGESMDSEAVQRLVQHDVENYLGVLGRRRAEAESPFGYQSWWLTLDHVAFEIDTQLRLDRNPDWRGSPLMTLDFLSVYLYCVQTQTPLGAEAHAAPVFWIEMSHVVPEAIIDAANTIRRQYADLPEHIVARRIRDRCDWLRTQ